MVASKSRMFRTPSGKLVTTSDAQKAGVSTDVAKLTEDDIKKLAKAASDRLGMAVNTNTLRQDGVGAKNNLLPSGMVKDVASIERTMKSQPYTKNKKLISYTPEEIIKEDSGIDFRGYKAMRFGDFAYANSDPKFQNSLRGPGGQRVSKNSLKSKDKENEQFNKIHSLAAKQAKKEYDHLVKTGKIKPRNFLEQTKFIADGQPDNPQVQAAKKVLEILNAAKK